MSNIEPAIPLSTLGEQLLKDALALPFDERARLADAIADSLDQAPTPDLGSAWQAEIARRLDALDSGQTKTVPWEEAEKMIFDGDDNHGTNKAS